MDGERREYCIGLGERAVEAMKVTIACANDNPSRILCPIHICHLQPKILRALLWKLGLLLPLIRLLMQKWISSQVLQQPVHCYYRFPDKLTIRNLGVSFFK